MKVWEARLILTLDMDDNWVVFFNFKEQEEDYTKSNNYYWELGKTWVANRIPISMQLSRHYSSYTAVQGFERELNEDELQELKENMKSFLIQEIEREKADYLTAYQKKINCLGN